MLNATWLETFTTLCEIGHFTRTADRLGMTQPGVSQHLRKLEAQVGMPLILKDGKAFTVTPAGAAVLSIGTARRVQERDLKEIVKVDDPNVGDVSLGCSGSFAMWVYPHLLEQMHRAPDLVIRLTAAPQASVVASVLNRDLDLGVVAENAKHPRLHASPLVNEEICLVVPAKFALDTFDFQRLDELGFVAHPDGFAYADDLFSLNFPDDYKGADRLNIRTSVNQIGQIPIPVARGLGYTILPKSGVEAFPNQKDISVIQLPKRKYHALWMISHTGRSKFARTAAVKRLVERATASLV
jgi:DNA-binding transcriptional LysR family regulator